MKGYIIDIIPKIQKFSKRLDDLSNLVNHHWVLFNDTPNVGKTVFIFSEKNKLNISNNGIVERSKWEYLGSESIILETKDQIYLLKHGFLGEKVLALKRDGYNEYLIFINESKAKIDFDSIDSVINFLNEQYPVKYLTNDKPMAYGLSQTALTSNEISKVKRLKSILQPGQVVVKHMVRGSIEIMGDETYKKWNNYYGPDVISLIERKD